MMRKNREACTNKDTDWDIYIVVVSVKRIEAVDEDSGEY